MFIELNRAQRDVLLKVVENHSNDLRTQIRRCANKSFRNELKTEALHIKGIIEDLMETIDIFDGDSPITEEEIDLMQGQRAATTSQKPSEKRT